MKKCPKCGRKNDNDANFCSNCRKKLEKTISRVDQSVGKKKKIFTVIASILLLLVIGGLGIFLFTRNNDSTTSNNSANSAKTKANNSGVERKADATKKESKKKIDKLVVSKLTPQQTVAAIIYYGSENVKPYDTWKELYDSNVNVYVTNRLIKNLDKQGQGVRYALLTDNNTNDKNYIGPSYTLDADNTVNYYSFNGFGGQRISYSEQSVSLDTIIKYINSNNDLATINKLVEKISVEDRRGESDNTITIDDYNQDELLKYKALILYGINHCEEWRNLNSFLRSGKLIITDRGPLITMTLDQAGGGFQIAETAATEGAPYDRYVFGGADMRTGKFMAGTSIDGRVGLISSQEVIDYANENGGKQRLDEMNVEIDPVGS
ncbi:hypothetical protein LmYK1_01580 [Ligilactobacillus murinus]|uniref:zinc ribbon domain-containing protein n=1 Tax=Ligilactobacillus murinus TaxID=1622 RepID=UPI001434EA4E|nr:zinc ribbon domain-containing protein [Ligilactobacillus murinus]BDI00918.1 hypothetical protein LmYK1_01580 [Ligilactobacillus murinus]GFI63248.1 hypothetical protein IMSAG117_00659 [Lactobacillaceae bacterium]